LDVVGEGLSAAFGVADLPGVQAGFGALPGPVGFAAAGEGPGRAADASDVVVVGALFRVKSSG
jgi:hypothetical protein